MTRITREHETGWLKQVLEREAVSLRGRLEQIVWEAWGELEAGRLWQASEKAFAAWKSAVALLLAWALAHRLSRQMLEEAEERYKGISMGVGATGTIEVELHVTTGSAPKIVNWLCRRGTVPACVLDGVRSDAYRLHNYFYEADPGRAGFAGPEEVRAAIERVSELFRRCLDPSRYSLYTRTPFPRAYTLTSLPIHTPARTG